MDNATAARHLFHLITINLPLLARYGMGDVAVYLAGYHCEAVDLMPHRVGRLLDFADRVSIVGSRLCGVRRVGRSLLTDSRVSADGEALMSLATDMALVFNGLAPISA